MYIVVFKNVSGSVSNGVITWSCFTNKDQFDNWWLNSKNAKNWYKIVEEGVTEQRAIDLCSTPKAKIAAAASDFGELLQLISPDSATH